MEKGSHCDFPFFMRVIYRGRSSCGGRITLSIFCNTPWYAWILIRVILETLPLGATGWKIVGFVLGGLMPLSLSSLLQETGAMKKAMKNHRYFVFLISDI